MQEDRDLVARLRPFARFSDPKEHDELIDNLLVAKKIRYGAIRHVTLLCVKRGFVRNVSEKRLHETRFERDDKKLPLEKIVRSWLSLERMPI